jgi:hypothetical protein
MLALTNTNASSNLSKDDLKRQIAALQAQLDTAPASPPAKRRKRDKDSDATVLAPATPSPSTFSVRFRSSQHAEC